MPPFDKTRTATPLPSLPIECAPHVDLELTEQQARTMLAIQAKTDSLVGLKENVILGKLIPAGTGLGRYRNIRVEPTAEARAAAYDLSYDAYDYDIAGTAPALAHDEFDLGDFS